MVSTLFFKHRHPAFFLGLVLSVSLGSLVALPNSDIVLAKFIVGSILIFGSLVAWLSDRSPDRQLILRLNAEAVLFLSILAMAAVSGALTLDRPTVLFGTYAHYQGLISLTALAIAFILTIQIDWTDERLRFAIGLLLAGGAIQAVFGLSQILAGFIGFDLMGVGIHKFRSTGLMGNANILGSYLVPIIPLGVYFARMSRGPIKVVSIISTGLIGVVALATLSITAWLATLAIGVLLVADRVRRWGRWTRKFTVVFLASSLVFAGFFLLSSFHFSVRGSIWQRILNLASPTGSLASRSDIWAAAWRLISQRPLFGWGPDAFEPAAPFYGKLGGVVELPTHTHNLIMEFAVNLGVPAALLLAALIVTALARWWRRPDAEDASAWGDDPALWIGLALVGMTVIVLAETLNFSAFLLLVVLLGIISRLVRPRWLKVLTPSGMVRSASIAISILLLTGWGLSAVRIVLAEAAYRQPLYSGKIDDQAVVSLNRAIDLNQDFPVYRYHLGQIYLRRIEEHGRPADLADGTKAMRAGQKAFPLDAKFHLLEAQMRLRSQGSGWEEKALKAAGRAQKLHPRSYTIQTVFGDIHFLGGRVEKAAAAYEAAIEAHPRFFEAWLGLGHARRLAGDTDGSLEAYVMARKIDSRDEEARYQALLAQALLDRDLPGKAREAALSAAARAARISPERYEPYELIGDIAYGAGDYKTAVMNYYQVAQLKPASARAWLMLAKARRLVGDDAGALRALNKALGIDPANIEALAEIAKIEQR